MKNRLIELIIQAKREVTESGSFVDFLADYLIENNVRMFPVKIGKRVYGICQTQSVSGKKHRRILAGQVVRFTFDEKGLKIFVRYNIGFMRWYTEEQYAIKVFNCLEKAANALEGGADGGE